MLFSSVGTYALGLASAPGRLSSSSSTNASPANSRAHRFSASSSGASPRATLSRASISRRLSVSASSCSLSLVAWHSASSDTVDLVSSPADWILVTKSLIVLASSKDSARPLAASDVMRCTSESSSWSINTFSSISSSLSSMASLRSLSLARNSSAPGSLPSSTRHRSAFSGVSALALSLATLRRSTMRSFRRRSISAFKPGTPDASDALASTDSSCFRISAAKARISSSRFRSSISPRRPTSTWRFTRSCSAATSSLRSTSMRPAWSLRWVSCSNLRVRRI
mmetsp:Transcript_350/g.1664  ORF Transcript_350/g.1664 Transcript_350/m.1664 type:complete len:282 (-) Transcript_350:1852-2697(-)